MGTIDDLKARVSALEEKMDVVIDLINDFIELVYEPQYVRKLDKLASYGKKEADGQG